MLCVSPTCLLYLLFLLFLLLLPLPSPSLSFPPNPQAPSSQRFHSLNSIPCRYIRQFRFPLLSLFLSKRSWRIMVDIARLVSKPFLSFFLSFFLFFFLFPISLFFFV